MCEPTAEQRGGALLPRLPTELVAHIISFLDVRSRTRLLAVNSAFNSLALRPAYSNLWLFHHPLEEPTRLPLHGNAAAHAAYVQVLDVFVHEFDACFLPPDLVLDALNNLDYRLLYEGLLVPLPSLRTLRLHLGSTDTWEGSLHSVPHIPCPAVQVLRPRTLVVRGCIFRAGEESFLADPEHTFEGPPDSIETLVCVFVSGSDHPAYSVQSGIVALVGERTTSATFVFWTPDRHTRLLPSCDEAADEVEWWLEGLADQLLHHAPLTGCRLTFVNAGAVGPTPTDGDNDEAEGNESDSEARQRSLEAFFRQEVAKRCGELGHDTEATSRRQGSIRFISMDEYLAGPDWLDVFDAEELGGWL